VSNSFVKSNENTSTNWFDYNMLLTVWKRAMSTAMVEPDGLKAYWSSTIRPGGVLESRINVRSDDKFFQ